MRAKASGGDWQAERRRQKRQADRRRRERQRQKVQRQLPTFTLTVIPVPGVSAEDAKLLTARAIGGALAETAGMP